MSGSGPDCSGVSIEEVFQACNTACANGDTTAIVDTTAIDCIEAIDDYNNGLTNDCHNQPLCNEDIGLCFEPPGPAGSSKANNKAIANDCTILAPENCEGCSD
jgi:hypothetical protein